MAKKILITGGTGLVATYLTKKLIERGYKVAHLSRNKNSDNLQVETYFWDVENKQIDEQCIDDADAIVHLAGAGIADERWTEKRKALIIKSRTESISLIYELMKNRPHKIQSIISASGSGYYSDRGDTLLKESEPPKDDFISQCCVLWEQAVDNGQQLGLRTVKLRTGLVLDKKRGALPKMALPIKFGLGAALGNGKQWVSWIHIADAADMYIHAIENAYLSGAYNMSSPLPITNKALNKGIASTLNKPLWLPNIPKAALKLALGDLSTVLLGSTKMDVKKIQDTGFKFNFPEINAALKDIYGR